ncbi:uncharacterized protein PITG_16689 [Phytophthora infestans T30-4]|uniref:BED-type domain-containing protein n=1 Tax=Phytophthora infestans (strain T30-4) TaxID=403677 RepID=D0NVE1_PHYIT|nr:uncharacterized protein PITG_16689 [Phytophthora infestans T30-4]EEY66618.1 hypothetical protein PITG_16689 [Phytophthora infestans T30-4]|eukprot:XP_002896919.1 hypothetical protein PITG_16689 [Phytophthora infestans T30-4]
MSDNLLAAATPQPTFTPRQICSFFFKPCLDEEEEPTGYYAYKTCGKCRKHTPKTGYTNLITHSLLEKHSSTYLYDGPAPPKRGIPVKLARFLLTYGLVAASTNR